MHPVSLTLSIRKSRFVLARTHHPSGALVRQGNIVKLTDTRARLTTVGNPESINYPVFFENINGVEGYVISIAYSINFDAIIINDSIVIRSDSTVFGTDQTHIKYMVSVQPNTLRIKGKPFKEGIFGKFEIAYNSRVYDIPSPCNYVRIETIPFTEYPIGFKLEFDRKSMFLSSDEDSVFLSKKSLRLTRNIKKSNAKFLKYQSFAGSRSMRGNK